ncbi:MAG: hypothetical protein JXL97_17280, partial [Bacteroidales bacterium]|nr:hypothetical protein [Bacteroidales bacterium]
KMENKDLTKSNLERQNILNNRFAVEEIQRAIGIEGVIFEEQYKFTTAQVAQFYEVDERTVRRYIEDYKEEIQQNGYEVLKGKRLKDFKLVAKESDVKDINVLDLAPSISIFNFRAFLNLGMLLRDSEKARLLRGAILDIVIETINNRAGGDTKYINQRDEDYIFDAFREPKYRTRFTDALKNFVVEKGVKYAIYTNKIYVSIFQEKAQEYRSVLKLEEKENVRDTMYAEVLRLIASYENGLASEIESFYNKMNKDLPENKKRRITFAQLDNIFKAFESHPLWEPLINDARIKMASRDYGFREAFHFKLKKYIQAVSPEDFERFLGERSKELGERIKETQETFKHLNENNM